ncbi:MAG: DUF1499 domain-containing protein [Hellea sp.]|nr:DUF1499 domain-containing protein [Hellea sp.]
MSNEDNGSGNGNKKPVIEIIEPNKTERKSDIIQHPHVTDNKRQRLRRLVLKIALLIALLIPLTFVIGAFGTKFGIWGYKFGFGFITFTAIKYLIYAGLFAGVAGLALAFVVQPRRGVFTAILALIIPLLAMYKGLSIKNTASRLPVIHDITTDTEDPPVFTSAIVERRNKVDGVNTLDYFEKKDVRENTLVSVLQSKHYPKINTVNRSEKPDVIFGEALALVRDKNWKIVTEDSDKRIIEAVDSSFWFGFKDDVIIRIRPSINGGSIIDMRSVSRVGQSDLGANAARIKKLMTGLEER